MRQVQLPFSVKNKMPNHTIKRTVGTCAIILNSSVVLEGRRSAAYLYRFGCRKTPEFVKMRAVLGMNFRREHAPLYRLRLQSDRAVAGGF